MTAKTYYNCKLFSNGRNTAPEQDLEIARLQRQLEEKKEQLGKMQEFHKKTLERQQKIEHYLKVSKTEDLGEENQIYLEQSAPIYVGLVKEQQERMQELEQSILNIEQRLLQLQTQSTNTSHIIQGL